MLQLVVMPSPAVGEFQEQPRKSPVKGILAGGSALGGWSPGSWSSCNGVDVVEIVEEVASSSSSEDDDDEEEEGSEGPASWVLSPDLPMLLSMS